MDERAGEHNDRVEGLLRGWGAAEAAENAAAKAGPAPTMVRTRVGWRAWVPTMAAAALLAAAVGLTALGVFRGGDEPRPAGGANADALATQLGAAREELAEVRRQLARAEAAAEDRREAFNAEVRRLERELAEQKAAMEAEADPELAELRQTVAEQRGAIERLAADLRVARQEADEHRTALADAGAEAERLRARLAEQSASIDRLAAETAAVAGELRDLQAVGRRYADLAKAMEHVYLAASVPHDAGLGTVKAAARRARLAPRAAAVRDRATGAAGRVVDAVEVVLTRLDLLDTRDPGEVQSFASLVRRGRVIERIEAALASGEVGPEVRAWLLEARLLLARLNHVG